MARRDHERTCQGVLRHAAAILLLACAGGTTAAVSPLDPARLTWRELHYRARKFIFTAETTVKAEVVPAETAAGELLRVDGRQAVQPAAGQLVRIGLDTTALGRHTRYRVWLQPGTGAALQSTGQEFGRRARFKVIRFTTGGVVVARFAPARGQDDEPADRWTERADSFVPLTEDDSHTAAVTDSEALFWVLSIGTLAAPGDSVELAVVSRNQLVLVTISVRGSIPVKVDFDEWDHDAPRHVEGSLQALELAVDARSLGSDPSADELEFLGMKGSIRIVLDPRLRVPLEISGRVPGAGIVVVRLRDVMLAN
jgi:hypothetical protein